MPPICGWRPAAGLQWLKSGELLHRKQQHRPAPHHGVTLAPALNLRCSLESLGGEGRRGEGFFFILTSLFLCIYSTFNCFIYFIIF